MEESIKMAAEIEGGLDDIIINALDSISTPHTGSMSGGRVNRSKSLAMSHQEKSKRLLRQCTSWTQLDDTKANRGIVHGQGENRELFFFIGVMWACWVLILFFSLYF